MRNDHVCVDGGDAFVFSFLAEASLCGMCRCGVVAFAHHLGDQIIAYFLVMNLCALNCGEGIIPLSHVEPMLQKSFTIVCVWCVFGFPYVVSFPFLRMILDKQ